MGETGHPHSGDGSTTCEQLMAGSVNYASLAWAHSWHVAEPVATMVPSRIIEYYGHLIGKWGERWACPSALMAGKCCP